MHISLQCCYQYYLSVRTQDSPWCAERQELRCSHKQLSRLTFKRKHMKSWVTHPIRSGWSRAFSLTEGGQAIFTVMAPAMRVVPLADRATPCFTLPTWLKQPSLQVYVWCCHVALPRTVIASDQRVAIVSLQMAGLHACATTMPWLAAHSRTDVVHEGC